MKNDPIDRLRIASPCTTSWELMEGDERVRHCALCKLNVYNIAELTRGEVRALLERNEGRVCMRLYRRADGTVITRDCPTGLRALRRRASRAAAAAVATLLSLPPFAFGGVKSKKLPLAVHGTTVVRLTREHVAAAQPAVLTGVVVLNGDAVPGVTVVLRNEATGRAATVITRDDGTFTFASLNDGPYRVDLTLSGIDPSWIEHLELTSNVVTHANIVLRLPFVGEVITIVSPEQTKHDPLSSTFTQSFIDKLPF